MRDILGNFKGKKPRSCEWITQSFAKEELGFINTHQTILNDTKLNKFFKLII